MPPKVKVTKDAIVSAGIEIVRESGADSVNARSVAAKIGCSTQPIFSNYASMDELKEDIIKVAGERYMDFTLAYRTAENFPDYKNTGLAYITYAKKERELFKLLFMRHRTSEEYAHNEINIEPVLDILTKATGLSRKDAELLHSEMWIFVHGIATMTATDYLDISDEDISNMMTDVFQGLLKRFSEKRN